MEIVRKIRLSRVAILIAVVVLVSAYCIYVRPMKLSTYMEKKIDISRVSSIHVNELIGVYFSYEYDIIDSEKISAIMDYLGNITTRRQLFSTDTFSSDPCETYLLTIVDENRKVVSLSAFASQVSIDDDALSANVPDNFRGLHDLITADGTP